MGAGEVAVIIPAAGKGKRMGLQENKIWIELSSRSIITYSLQLFEDHPAVGKVVLVVSGAEKPRSFEVIGQEGYEKVTVVEGGAERRDSIYRGLFAVDEGFSWVLIHDGARPLLTRDLVDRTLEAAYCYGAAICAVPVQDTVKRADVDGLVVETLLREGLYQVQTPQVFDRKTLLRAHEVFPGDVTDDSSLVERLGQKVKVVPGSLENLKITTPEDLRLAEWVLTARNVEGGKTVSVT